MSENMDKEIDELFPEDTATQNPLQVPAPAAELPDSADNLSDYTELPNEETATDFKDSAPAPDSDQMKPLDTANIIIGLLDQIQTTGLSFAYEKQNLTKADIAQAKAYKAQYGKDWGLKKGDEEIAQEIVALRNTYERVKDYTKELPLSPKEQEILRISLMQMVVKYNWKMSAEVAFIGSMLTVFGPRMLPLFMGV